MQIADCRIRNKGSELTTRFVDFAAEAIRFAPRLQRTAAGRYISNQFLRAAASSGANYQEARGAESTADFLHKLQVVLTELREAEYWLLLVERAGLASGDPLPALRREADELVRIVVASVKTAKGRVQDAGTSDF